jgi:hypothetical protein
MARELDMATAVATDDERRAEFERVMQYAKERAWADGLEEAVMAALFDVFNGGAQERRGSER